MAPKVSIVIPTYNRAKLLPETLDSIIAQTHNNWECIVVDDGSNDGSLEVLEGYAQSDSRFIIFKRPSHHLPGGNGARNFGLLNSTGDYVIFFDSDDLMTENHISKKLGVLLSTKVDFVIAKTKFLNSDSDFLERYYTFDQYKITAHNFIVQNINWLTYDTLIKSSIAKSIFYNEHLKSGQEYNYFSKLILKTSSAHFINEYLTLRRMHETSKQGSINKGKDDRLKWQRSLKSMWLTYLDIETQLPKKTKKTLLYRCIRTIYRCKQFALPHKAKFLKELYKNFGFESYHFLLMLLSRKYFNKGYNYREKFKSKVTF